MKINRYSREQSNNLIFFLDKKTFSLNIKIAGPYKLHIIYSCIKN